MLGMRGTALAAAHGPCQHDNSWAEPSARKLENMLEQWHTVFAQSESQNLAQPRRLGRALGIDCTVARTVHPSRVFQQGSVSSRHCD